MEQLMEQIDTNHSLDWNRVQLLASELGELFLQSQVLAEYIQTRQSVYSNPRIAQEMKRFDQAKQAWEDTEQYGPFHPDYRAKLDELQLRQVELEAIVEIQNYMQSEQALDDLFYEVSRSIAFSVSEQIKVPSNSIVRSSSGCGGNCNGGCG